jgi:hypothetical protein
VSADVRTAAQLAEQLEEVRTSGLTGFELLALICAGSAFVGAMAAIIAAAVVAK